MPDPISEAVGRLYAPNAAAYQALRQLEAESARSNAVYPYLDTFIRMLDDKNSYVRTRGLTLIAANARWDGQNQIDGIIGRCLRLVTDEKPVTARQCVKALPALARYKPALRAQITAALQSADTSAYPGSMRPLVERDIAEALSQINGQG